MQLQLLLVLSFFIIINLAINVFNFELILFCCYKLVPQL